MYSTKSMFPLFLSEMAGTALLLAIGLSIVIFNWGNGSMVIQWIPSESVRRLLTGFLFGCTGCLVTISPVGKISGAHINPAVSIAFWLKGTMKSNAVLGYIASQMIGAVLGSLPLLLWGNQGKSIHYANTTPQNSRVLLAFAGEALTTAGLITVIFFFVGHKKLRNYTPYTMPLLYGFMVWAEGPLSGCSTNPARSFGPAIISGVFTDYWLYWLAPLTGVLLVLGASRVLKLYRFYHLESARISYHKSHTHECLKKTAQP